MRSSGLWLGECSPVPSRARALRSAAIRRRRLRARFSDTVVTHAGSDAMSAPRSDRSQALATASCTASSAAARLPATSERPPTSLG